MLLGACLGVAFILLSKIIFRRLSEKVVILIPIAIGMKNLKCLSQLRNNLLIQPLYLSSICKNFLMSRKLYNIFLIVLIVCHLFYWLFVYPNPDEAYYWQWGRYPAISYHDHPALPPLIQGLFYNWFGKSLFVLRLPVVLSTLLSVFIYSKILTNLGFRENKKAILLIIFSLPLIFLFTSFAWHDHLMIAMLLCSSYFWLCYFTEKFKGNQGRSLDVFSAFLFLGLAALSKYNAVFLALTVVSTISMNKKLHSVWKEVRFYLGIILCAAIASPIFIWNMQNQFGSFEFTLAQRTIQPLLEGRFFKGNIFGFLLGTIALLTPFITYFTSIKSVQKIQATDAYTAVYKSLAKHLFWWSSGVFLFLSLFSNVLYYWNIPAYLLLLPLVVEYIIENFPKLTKSTIIYSGVVIILIVIHFGVVPLTVFVGAKDNDGAYHYGWKEVKEKIVSQPEYNENIPLFGSSYRVASLLAYTMDRKDVFSYSERFDQFDYWTKNIQYNQPDAFILADDYSKIDEELLQIFEDIQVTDTIKINRFGFPVKEYYLYKGSLRNIHVK